MAILSLFYAAFGYLALLVAILWGMLFVGGGVSFPNMDAAGTAAPVEAAFVDVGLLLLLALLHLSRGMLQRVAQRSLPSGLERSTQAWAAAAALAVLYFGWRPLPQVLWSGTGPLQGALSALFYIAWTLILIGAFLASHRDLFEIVEAPDVTLSAAAARRLPFTDTLRQPLYWGILMAVWATPVMTVGHMLLAAAVTAYLLFDVLWAARKSGVARGSRRTVSLQGRRVSIGRATDASSAQAIAGIRPAKETPMSLARATRIGPSSPAAPQAVNTRP
jgi:protein-S-isoprenylcysteine O-methyltransferase Ste14